MGIVNSASHALRLTPVRSVKVFITDQVDDGLHAKPGQVGVIGTFRLRATEIARSPWRNCRSNRIDAGSWADAGSVSDRRRGPPSPSNARIGNGYALSFLTPEAWRYYCETKAGANWFPVSHEGNSFNKLDMISATHEPVPRLAPFARRRRSRADRKRHPRRRSPQRHAVGRQPSAARDRRQARARAVFVRWDGECC